MYSVFRNLAIIMISAKFFGLVARKCKAPQVVGEIIAGLLIGPCLLNLVHTSDTIEIFAEIGVVLLMFTTGLGTNLKSCCGPAPLRPSSPVWAWRSRWAAVRCCTACSTVFLPWAARSSIRHSLSVPS